MKHFQKLLLSVSILTISGLSVAEPVTELRNCAKLDSDLKRLACFDEAVKGLSGQITITTTSSVTIPSDGSTTVVPQAVTTAPVTAQAPKDSFGLGNKITNAEPDEIHSKIVGKFMGWSGKTKFTLENGQIWKQVDPTRKVVFKATNPKVTIKKAVFGSYRLKIDGLNSTLTVKRIK